MTIYQVSAEIQVSSRQREGCRPEGVVSTNVLFLRWHPETGL